MNIQQHLEIQASAQQWADDFMKNYNISATEMTDALTKVLLNLKDQVIVEYLTEIAQQQMSAAAMPNDMSLADLQEDIQSQTPQEEEVNNGGNTNE